MLRRQNRLRREYLYRKSLEAKEQAIFERKQLLKDALANNKPIPTEFKEESRQLVRELQYDESQDAPTTHIDDEYAQAGVYDPKVLITTTHNPNTRVVQFMKELRSIFPNAQKMNRGHHSVNKLVEICRVNQVTDLVVVTHSNGQPSGMTVCHFPHGPTVYFTLFNVVLRHDIPNIGSMSEAYPHLIFHNFSTTLGTRVTNVLKHLFPVPKEDTKRVMTFANDNDFISFRHHVYQKTSHKEVMLAEVGPRFEMRVYEIRLGTLDIADADVEWVLQPYRRTAPKKQML
ncbi:snoRNA-binding rRNA-processing protein imp4 [Dimargaris verticillata]|uniref:U3 small nucleolar ribonucleoprotein protein IMP4 n=1 Tax=Dimargaris verticillata TaxID=2761393 RepID=A0A9W8B0X2_9FUNG|nr:snoRNA-binding rRNA-processing protein imp4 [Dimargaris verticillata]